MLPWYLIDVYVKRFFPYAKRGCLPFMMYLFRVLFNIILTVCGDVPLYSISLAFSREVFP